MVRLSVGAGAGLGVAPCFSGLAVGGAIDGSFVGRREVEVVGELDGDHLRDAWSSRRRSIFGAFDRHGLLISVPFREVGNLCMVQLRVSRTTSFGSFLTFIHRDIVGNFDGNCLLIPISLREVRDL